MSATKQGTILLAGASRGLGLGLAGRYLADGWSVIATARRPDAAAGLARLQEQHPERLRIEALDIASSESAARLAQRLTGTTLNVLFVVAGISEHSGLPIHEVPPAAVGHEFVTNATAPIALAEALQSNLAPQACVVFMTSRMGSIAGNQSGGMELYRGTKAALNMFASCYALRHTDTPVLLLHPGWVRTELGGAQAPLDVDTSVQGLAEVVAEHGRRPGVAYLDYQGKTLPW